MSHPDAPEKDISAAFNFPSKFVTIRQMRLHYVEQGMGDPMLFLHGIPANLYLWRNILPEVADSVRAIAVDLAGFGQSDVPASGGYNANNQYTYLEGFIETLDLKNLTLVMTDLGSLLGMKYAADHPDRIKGLVVMEGMIMPAYEYYQQLSFMQKMMYALFRNRTIARSILVNGTRIQNQIVPMMTLRPLSTTEQLAYTTPYVTDPEKRKVVLDGPGPVGFPRLADLKLETAHNESVIMMNATARKLKGTPIPMLLLYANPGVILNKGARDYATAHYPKLTIQYVGKGKHFMPEEHPKKMGQFIKNWLDNQTDSGIQTLDMVKNPMLSQDKQAFVDRLNTLTPRSQAQWGKMNVAQMLKHLNELVELANGTRVLPSNTLVSSLIGRLVRNWVINNDKPLPKGLGNAPLPVAAGFETEKKLLFDALNSLDFTKTSNKPLPLFGKLSADEWDKFLSKQLAHHLTQFGA